MYDQKWAERVFEGFSKVNPRVHSVNLFLIQLARERGLLLCEGQIRMYAIRAIRVPKYGQEYWKLYKKVVKGKYPPLTNLHWWGNFWLVLKTSARRCGEELSQIELIYD